jgi:hypothetical protein
MEAVYSSKTSSNFYRIRRYNPEDSTVHSNEFFGYVNFEKFLEYQIESVLASEDGVLSVQSVNISNLLLLPYVYKRAFSKKKWFGTEAVARA